MPEIGSTNHPLTQNPKSSTENRNRWEGHAAGALRGERGRESAAAAAGLVPRTNALNGCCGAHEPARRQAFRRPPARGIAAARSPRLTTRQRAPVVWHVRAVRGGAASPASAAPAPASAAPAVACFWLRLPHPVRFCL
jgi:hypothetical protein